MTAADVARENRELHRLRAQVAAILAAWDACTDRHPDCRDHCDETFLDLFCAIDVMAGKAS